MKRITFVILLMGPFYLLAQKVGRNQAVEDLTFLVESIKKYSPALAQYHPEFDSLSALEIRQVSGDSLTSFDYFSKVSTICALANEGHFSVGGSDAFVFKGIVDNTYAYLPIEVKIIAGRLYLSKDYSNEQSLNAGDEILSMNGMETEALLKKLLAVTPSDGEILTYAYRKIQEGFPWLYLFHIQEASQVEITILGEDQQKRTVTVTTLVRSDQVANYKTYYPRKEGESTSPDEGFYTLQVEPDYALLRLPSFDFRRVNRYKVKSQKLYKEIFKELQDKEVKNLVIDLRDNTGGRNEFADDMVPFVLDPSQADPFLKKTVSWEGKERIYKMPNASPLAFKGSIYVWVNGKTFSAGNSLARYLKEYGNATVIGTETGTRYEGFAGGSNQEISLPNMQLKIGIPRYHIFYPKSAKQPTSNRGILPDYTIEHTFESLSKGKDLHLEKVLALINSE